MRRSYAGKGACTGCCLYLLWHSEGVEEGEEDGGHRVFGSAFAYGKRLTGALQINFVSLRVSHDICIKACCWQQRGMGWRRYMGEGAVALMSHACRSCQ